MQIIICGAGEVGFNLAQYLSKQGNDVTVIESSENLIERISNEIDARIIVGLASHPDVLEEAGAENADILIAVTRSDEVNMMACQIAHTLFDTPKKIARIRERVFMEAKWSTLFMTEQFPIDVIISPESEVANAMYAQMKVPGCFDYTSLLDGDGAVIGIDIQENCPLLHTPLRQLSQVFPDLQIQILPILRDDELTAPKGSVMLEPGDKIYCAIDTNQLERVLSAFGIEQIDMSSIIIGGASNVGYYFANILKANEQFKNIRIIEPDQKIAQKTAELLNDITVFHGDLLNSNILHEAQIETSDAYFGVSDIDEINILSAGLAKNLGTKYSVASTRALNYRQVNINLFIDSLVLTRDITISKILKHIRCGSVEHAHLLFDERAELIETTIPQTSVLCGCSVSQSQYKKYFIIGAMKHNDKFIIPNRDTIIEAGDRIVFFVKQKNIKKFEQLISGKTLYL